MAHFLLMCIFVAKNSINQIIIAMKRFTLFLMALLAFSFSLKAQQYVSTEPSNRNVILEEFTGRGCQYCPDGHRIANEIAAANPGRFWAINVHAGGYAQTSYPNFITTDGNTIHGGFSISGYPTGVVNRSTAAGQSRSAWASLSNQQMNQASECNVAGRVIVNPETRIATITVEVYYTSNSSADENYLTVAMLQDSILGSQTGMSYNPSQIIGSQYCHMHILRDVITESAWGEAISPTTQGTLITREYVYEIPEIIGSPNGVEVDLDNIFFLAWVSERYQGTPTRPILTGCELDLVQGVDEPIYPIFAGVNQTGGATCSHTKDVEVNIQNIGTETLTSMTLQIEFEGETQTINWEGELPRYAVEKIATTLQVPFGTFPVHVTLTEANGEPLQKEATGSVNCVEWDELQIEGEEEQLRLFLMQDHFGNHTTWEFTASDGTVLASGGPYTMLAGATATQLHIEEVTIPANECVLFTIYDEMGNGICCAYGHGYYIVKDSQGNVLFGDEDDGEFGESASHLFSVVGAVQATITETMVSGVDYNHADFMAHIDYSVRPEEVGFIYRKVTNSTQYTVEGHLNEFSNIVGFTDDLEHSTIYMVKAYAIINGQTFYGAETTFQTWMEGVDELSQTLKLYPNPTSNVLNIEGEGMSSFEVYNAVGQRVLTQEVNGNKAQVNTASLNSGIYFIRIYAIDGAMLNRTFSVTR